MSKLIISILFLINISFPSMLKPENGTHLNYIHILFEWEQMDNATSYNIQIDNDDSFANPIVDVNKESLVYIETNMIDWESTYYWRIQPVYLDGSSGNWEQTFNFTTSSTRSEAYSINYDDNSYSDGLTIFSSFFNYFTAILDQNGNEVWNTGDNNIVYYNTDFFGQYFGCYIDNDLENYLPGIEFSIDNELLWEEPNNDFLHHELIKLPNGNFLGLIETTQLGPIPFGDWTAAFQYLGYEADGETNEFPWVGDKIVIWDKDTNNIIWEWNTFDYFSMDDFDEITSWDQALNLGRYDWTHANALWPTFDDNNNLESIYISSRHLSRITKINYSTSQVDWNLGLEMPSGDVDCGQDILFSFQHSISVTEQGTIMTLDNGNLSQYINDTPYPTTRGLEIEIIETEDGCESEVIWEHSLPASYFGYASGNVQKLENNNYLIVTIGNGGSALEVDQDNNLIWEGKFNLQMPNGAVYRANRISGLYPVAYSFIVNNLYKEDGISYIDNDDGQNIDYILYNDGNSEEEYNITIWYNQSEDISLNESIILDPEETHVNTIAFNDDISSLQINISPKHRNDLTKDFNIFINNYDCDTDGDGICDNEDDCPFDINNDTDGDNICDSQDLCPEDPNNDSDNDGSCDSEDICIGDDESGDSDLDNICDDTDQCPQDYFNDSDGDGICDSDDTCPDDSENECQDEIICDDGYTFLSNIPFSTIVIDGSNCFSNIDLSVLIDIISINNIDNEDVESPIHLGTQNWSNNRLTRLEVGNYFQGGNVSLSELPNSIGDLSNITVLYLNYNELTMLPESITELDNLIYLVLSFNNLVALPENIGNMPLVWIDAGYNQISYIPNSIGDLENIMYLWIFNNNLSSLPESICNLNIDWNSLDYNFLPYFGAGGNQLCENLPECIENSENLNSSIDPLYYSFVIIEEQNCEDSCMLMDVNNDGTINVIDIVNTVNLIFNIGTPDEQQLCAADANQDGIINVIDIVTIVNYIFSI